MVVLYHTGVAFSGGYVGVDMFFVISGFVISQLLIRETNETSKINLLNFYSRRIKRILPAVTFATVGTLFLSIFALSPFGEQKQVVDTARASTFFAANFYFYLQDSYWALAENPLRHLWSLAVEEQFYLVFPVLLFIFGKAKLRLDSTATKLWLIAVAIFSFTISFFLSSGSQILPKPALFAFFGTPWRIWEFIVGVLIALTPNSSKKLNFMATPVIAISLVALFWSVSTFDSFTMFPGSAAAVPVFSTALLIYFGNNKTVLTQLICAKPFTFLGNISYSWYLWHWPLIVFAHRVFPASEKIAPLVAALLSVAVAYFSLRRIENPIRRNEELRGKRVIRLAVVCIAIPLAFSFGVQMLSTTGLGLTELRNNSTIRASYSAMRNCQFGTTIDQQSDECEKSIFGTKNKTIMLVGDSGASAFSDAVAQVAKDNDFQFATYYTNGCPITYQPLTYRIDCAENFAKMRSKINEIDPSVLVVANMSDLYVDGSGLGAIIRDFNGTAAKDRYEALDFWVLNWNLLLKSDIFKAKVLVIQQPPLSAMREPILLQKFFALIGNKTRVERLFDEEVSLDNSDTRNMIVKAEAELFKNYKNIAVFDPASVLCDAQNCRQTLNGEPLYYDGRHLTVKGSLLMVDGITKAIAPLIDEK